MTIETFTAIPVLDGPFGLVTDVEDTVGASRVYAFDPQTEDDWRFVIPDDGAVYGFVQRGAVNVSGPTFDWTLRAGQWWVAPNGCRLDFYLNGRATGGRTIVREGVVIEEESSVRVVAVQRVGHRALSAAGGPIESRGRLRYIDACSDTLLAPPARQGDPCLNHLHFPPGIEQTFHTHPSVRAGVVARGGGWCELPPGRTHDTLATGALTPAAPTLVELCAGTFWIIPAGAEHRFLTRADERMDVIAYHPDSDWGPTDEQHPMLNRTWSPGTEQALEHDRLAQVEHSSVGGC